MRNRSIVRSPELTLLSRFSDRDSLMRTHWGYGIGHIHAHNRPPVARPDPLLSSMDTDVEEDENFSTQQDTPTVRPSMASTSMRAPTQDVDISDAEDDAEVPDAEDEDDTRKRSEWAVDDQEDDEVSSDSEADEVEFAEDDDDVEPYP